MPAFNPMRVLTNKVLAQWPDRTGQIPADTSAEPVIGHVSLPGMAMDLHKFSSFVPIAMTAGDFEEMPLLAGQGVSLVGSVLTAAEAISAMVTDAALMLRTVAARTS